MVIKLSPQPTILCQGDNFTYSGRREDSDGGVEDGYARLAAELTHARAAPAFLNPDISGNRTADLRARWDADAMGLAPDRENPDPRIEAVRRLVEEFHAALLTADGLINQAAPAAGSADLVAHDGVHPTPFGHRVLAQAWPDLVTIA
jgi:lysophospholipase L1-like esterase